MYFNSNQKIHNSFCPKLEHPCSIAHPFPPCFRSPPLGEEDTYNNWAERWMELYGGVDASCELKNALIDYKKAVSCLQEDQRRMHKLERENEEEAIKIKKEQREAYSKKRKAEDEVDEEKKILKVAKNCLWEAEESLFEAIRSGSDHDEKVARMGLEIAKARFGRAKTSFQEAKKYVERANKDIEESEKQPRSAADDLDTARRYVVESLDEVEAAKLTVDKLLGLAD